MKERTDHRTNRDRPPHAVRDLLVEGQFFFFKHRLGWWAVANGLVYLAFLITALIVMFKKKGGVSPLFFAVVIASYFVANALFIPFLGRVFPVEKEHSGQGNAGQE